MSGLAATLSIADQSKSLSKKKNKGTRLSSLSYLQSPSLTKNDALYIPENTNTIIDYLKRLFQKYGCPQDLTAIKSQKEMTDLYQRYFPNDEINQTNQVKMRRKLICEIQRRHFSQHSNFWQHLIFGANQTLRLIDKVCLFECLFVDRKFTNLKLIHHLSMYCRAKQIPFYPVENLAFIVSTPLRKVSRIIVMAIRPIDTLVEENNEIFEEFISHLGHRPTITDKSEMTSASPLKSETARCSLKRCNNAAETDSAEHQSRILETPKLFKLTPKSQSQRKRKKLKK